MTWKELEGNFQKDCHGTEFFDWSFYYDIEWVLPTAAGRSTFLSYVIGVVIIESYFMIIRDKKLFLEKKIISTDFNI